MKSSMLFILLCFLFSCGTVKTYYGDTEIILPQQDDKVYRLDLSYQSLVKIPNSVLKSKSIRFLNLTGNIDVDLRGIEQMSELRVLVLDSINCKNIPGLQSLSKLRQLSCKNNLDLNIEGLIDQLLEMNMERLDLSSNNLQILPKGLSNIESLTGLKLTNNAINKPEALIVIGKMKNLSSLWLDGNGIEILPKTVASLDKIEYLYLDNNNINNLPIEMSNLRKLKVLHLYGNKLEKLPLVFIDMPKLLFAFMSNNKISEIPNEFFTNDIGLMALVLTGNPLMECDKIKAKRYFRKFFLLEM